MHWINRIQRAASGHSPAGMRTTAALCQTASRQRRSKIYGAALITTIFLPGHFVAANARQTSVPAATPATQSTSPQTGQTQPITTPIPPATPPHPPELRFLVVLDPAHGGADNGALLAPASPEKNYTLALAIRLHAILNAHGIRSIFTRDADTAVDPAARAVTANRAHAAACILLHATSTGNGVHLFTSSLSDAGQQITRNPRRAFLPWRTAQASYGTESLRLESDINAALADQHIPALLDRTPLAPLDNLACPAVAVEVAPLDSNTRLTDPAYQQKIAQSLAAALAQWRSDWRQQP